MKNPWEEITLSDYENHMSLDSVRQLQALERIMGEQLCAFPVSTVCIFGIAGGNGLSHVREGGFRRVYGIDVNERYLAAVKERYPDLSGTLVCLRADLTEVNVQLPEAELLIADLLIEYIGYDAFTRAAMKVRPSYVSCVIQINEEDTGWVSDSPYLHAFDGLDAVHHPMEETALCDALEQIGYSLLGKKRTPLPNGKALLRLDYRREEEKR